METLEILYHLLPQISSDFSLPVSHLFSTQSAWHEIILCFFHIYPIPLKKHHQAKFSIRILILPPFLFCFHYHALYSLRSGLLCSVSPCFWFLFWLGSYSPILHIICITLNYYFRDIQHFIQRSENWGTCVAQLVKCLTLDFSSCHLRVMRLSPELGSTLSGESA